jgi:hypothetical protein
VQEELPRPLVRVGLGRDVPVDDEPVAFEWRELVGTLELCCSGCGVGGVAFLELGEVALGFGVAGGCRGPGLVEGRPTADGEEPLAFLAVDGMTVSWSESRCSAGSVT